MCGIFGIYGNKDAAVLTTLGLHALQHRGQESAGIVTLEGNQLHTYKELGLVCNTLNNAEVLSGLPGPTAIGHVRYSTNGANTLRNAQPLVNNGIAVAQNGNITNTEELRAQLNSYIFQSTTDTELILHLIDKTGSIENAVQHLRGGFSIVLIADTKVIGVRDPNGVRPLVIGKLDDTYILSSESCAFDLIGAEFHRNVEPGEMVVLDENGITSSYPFSTRQSNFCIFEYIYISRPDSYVEDRRVYSTRKLFGTELAREDNIEADIVVPIPDSGVSAALGYAEMSKLPFELGIVRSHYVGRTFIEPSEHIRHFNVRLKHSPNRDILKNKKVILVDDSIVRGTTSTKVVEMIRNAGVKEVHMRISSPPIFNPCFYGVDTPRRRNLLAATHSMQEMADKIGVDSLKFLSIDGLYRVMKSNSQFCDACFTGNYL